MSDEKRWTPGPWRVIEKEKPIGYAKYEIAWSDDGEIVCDAVYHPEDAHLIAAAPELYEELERLLGTVLAAIQAGDWMVDGACEPDQDIRKSVETLAKARGGS